jgi:predicted enzyme related to lactoylglutathione lyase
VKPVTFEGLSFHHVGVAVDSIAEAMELWAALGYVAENDGFSDATQGIEGQFMLKDGHRIELLADLAGHATVKPWLKKGTVFYHFGYTCDDIMEAVEALKRLGGHVLRPPVASVYFNSRLISFVMLPSGAVIELIAN